MIPTSYQAAPPRVRIVSLLSTVRALKSVAGPDLNRRPSGYEPDALPSGSTRLRIVSLLSTVKALKLVARAGFVPTTFGL